MREKEVFDCIKDAEEDSEFWDERTYDRLRLVWFNYTLGNWKALAAVPFLDLYWEVTWDSENEVVYVDRYKKEVQVVLDDYEEMGG